MSVKRKTNHLPAIVPQPRGWMARARPGRRLMLLWAMLFAVTWQGFVAQTHAHQPFAQQVQAAISGQGSDRDQPFDTPANCSICREIAAAGPGLLPSVASIHAPVAVTSWTAPLPLRSLALVQRSHLWRSRAPPLSLQA